MGGLPVNKLFYKGKTIFSALIYTFLLKMMNPNDIIANETIILFSLNLGVK